MYYLDEPFVHDKAQSRRERKSLYTGMIAGLSIAAVVGFTAQRYFSAAPSTTALFGASAGCAKGGPNTEESGGKVHTDKVRALAKIFVDSLGADIKDQTYYPDASKQKPQWQICTIVQQCLVPKYGLPVARLTPASRTKFYDILAMVLSDESYKRIMVQQLSNLLLGEMQNWATSCKGQCEELNDPAGLLPHHLLSGDELDSHVLDISYEECGKLATEEKRHTYWACEESPKMLHHGNMDTETGKYQLGNVFLEPAIHARNHNFDYVAVYGSLKEGEPFGFRYSGHHFDLSFQIDADGHLSDLPTFLGHNPLIVPKASPPQNLAGHHEDYLQWHNMAGVPQFPDAVEVVLEAARVLPLSAYVPLTDWLSTPANGGLTLKANSIDDVPHLDLSTASVQTFETIWALVDYTLEFSRGGRSRAKERKEFLESGKMVWTTCQGPEHIPTTVNHLTSSRSFFYVRIETDTLVFFLMVNSLFSLMLEHEPSNHLHSIIIPKSYLELAARAPEG